MLYHYTLLFTEVRLCFLCFVAHVRYKKSVLAAIKSCAALVRLVAKRENADKCEEEWELSVARCLMCRCPKPPLRSLRASF